LKDENNKKDAFDEILKNWDEDDNKEQEEEYDDINWDEQD